jgi:putative transposase
VNSQPGKYFVTICSQNRDCAFGSIINEEMHLSVAGEIVKEEWLKTSDIRPEIELDVFHHNTQSFSWCCYY